MVKQLTVLPQAEAKRG